MFAFFTTYDAFHYVPAVEMREEDKWDKWVIHWVMLHIQMRVFIIPTRPWLVSSAIQINLTTWNKNTREMGRSDWFRFELEDSARARCPGIKWAA